MNKKQLLEQGLQKAEGLFRLYKSNEFQEFLLPFLRKATDVKWLDIKTFKDKDDFIYEYQKIKAKAEAYAELINMMEGLEAKINKLRLEIARPERTYAITNSSSATKRGV